MIAGIYAGFNRRQLPATTPDCVNVDHQRLGRTVEASELQPSIHAMWELTPDFKIRVESVHRLTDLGAVIAHSASGTSRDGFAAEWRMIDLLMIDGDRLSHYASFDEADLDTALSRFDEISG